MMTAPSPTLRPAGSRPRCAIGHIGPLSVSSVPESASFYAELGMRSVIVREQMAILELRGGTHLILRAGAVAGGRLPFDLMVDDVHAVREELLRAGHRVSPVRRGGVHTSFELVDPDGYRVPITSSHAMGPV